MVRPGGRFEVTSLACSDLEAAKVKAPWFPNVEHPAIPKDQAKDFLPQLVAGVLLAIHAGEWRVEDQWNRLLPGYEFTSAENFLKEHWEGRP